MDRERWSNHVPEEDTFTNETEKWIVSKILKR